MTERKSKIRDESALAEKYGLTPRGKYYLERWARLSKKLEHKNGKRPWALARRYSYGYNLGYA